MMGCKIKQKLSLFSWTFTSRYWVCVTPYQRVEMISADGFTGPVDEEQSDEAFYHLQTQDQALDSLRQLENNKRTENRQKGLA